MYSLEPPIVERVSSSANALHLTPYEAAKFARRLVDDGGEAVVLSTCNRTEVYLAHQEPKAAAARARGGLARLARLSEVELAAALSAAYDDAAALQLFRVAANCSGSPPALTHSFQANRRSSARCAPRTRPRSRWARADQS